MSLDLSGLVLGFRCYLLTPLFGGLRSLGVVIVHILPYSLVLLVPVLSHIKTLQPASYSSLVLWSACFYVVAALGLCLLFRDLRKFSPSYAIGTLLFLPWYLLYFIKRLRRRRAGGHRPESSSPYGPLPYGYGTSSPHKDQLEQPAALPSPDAIAPHSDEDAAWEDTDCTVDCNEKE